MVERITCLCPKEKILIWSISRLYTRLNKCREEIAVTVALNEFCKRWCRRDHVECNALNSKKISIFNIIEKRISFLTLKILISYHLNLNFLSDI